MHAFHKYLMATVLGMLTLRVVAQPVNADFAVGERNYEQCDWDGAISNFTKSVESAYNLRDSYSYRAYAWAMKGNVSGAMADCDHLVALEPNDADSYYWRTRVELILTNKDAALRDFDIGLKMNPRSRPADLAERMSVDWHQRGFKKSLGGDLDGAISCLNEAVRLDPTSSYPYSLRGYFKMLQGRSDSAIADAFLALKFNPKNTDAWETLAWARFERGDVSGSAEACEKELEVGAKLAAVNELAYPKAQSLIPAGLLCFINGDFSKAADDWSDSISLNKKMPAPLRSFLQSWIEKAKKQEAQNKNLTATNSSPTPDAR